MRAGGAVGVLGRPGVGRWGGVFAQEHPGLKLSRATRLVLSLPCCSSTIELHGEGRRPNESVCDEIMELADQGSPGSRASTA